MEPIFRHRTPVQIRFNDLDAFNHVNNNVYTAYYDLGKERYFAETLPGDFYQLPVACIVAHIEFDFLLPIHYGDEIAIDTRVSHIGTKSFTLQQRVINLRTEQILCTGTTVMVCIDKETQNAVPMPAEYRASFERFEAGTIV